METLYRLGWVVSPLLAVAGAALYLTVPGEWTWWVGGVMASTVLGMALWRYHRADSRLDHAAEGDGGPLTPP